MGLASYLRTVVAFCLLLPACSAVPTPQTQNVEQLQYRASSNRSTVPIAIWHGLGDRYDNTGLTSMGDEIKKSLSSDTFIYYVRIDDDGAKDQKATLFGNIDKELAKVAGDLKGLGELDGGYFDAVGLSQGGLFWRGYVERYGGKKGYPQVRNLITMGTPHMGISASPPCRPTDFFCKATQWALKSGVWTPYAQSGIVPAQYFRNQDRIEDYLEHSSYLRDINNERSNDTQPYGYPSSSSDEPGDTSPRNTSYYRALTSLENFVLFSFSLDATVVPWTSPSFSLPSPEDTLKRLDWEDLPLYQEDYIGLKKLDREGRLHRRTCEGAHMEIDERCMKEVIDWLKRPTRARESETDSHAWSARTGVESARFVMQN